MKRKIISIDAEKCNGCEICVKACHEGAIEMINGKAVLVSDSYCDGLGDCLPECPTGAITMIERVALPYDQLMVDKKMASRKAKTGGGGCPSMRGRVMERGESTPNGESISSQLGNWPLQLKLVSSNAPYLYGASLLIAADCTAFSYGNFHEEFIKGRVTLIGCPKLDDEDYTEKVLEIINLNQLKDITVLRMEVPCCSGIAGAVQRAVEQSGQDIPLSIKTITISGELL